MNRQPRIQLQQSDLTTSQVQERLEKASKEIESICRQHSEERAASERTIQQQAERIRHLESEIVGLLMVINGTAPESNVEAWQEASE